MIVRINQNMGIYHVLTLFEEQTHICTIYDRIGSTSSKK